MHHGGKQYTIQTTNLYFRSGSPLDVPLIHKPDKFAGMTYVEALNSLDWTLELKNSLQDLVRFSGHMAGCMSSLEFETASNSSTYPKIDSEYIPKDECTEQVGSTSPVVEGSTEQNGITSSTVESSTEDSGSEQTLGLGVVMNLVIISVVSMILR